MRLFQEIKTNCNNFIYKVREENSIYMPKLSLYENIASSYNLVLNEKQKAISTNYNNASSNFNAIKTKIEEKERIVFELNHIIRNFEELYSKKDSENQLKVLEKKAFIRIKEKELEDTIRICKAREIEKKELIKKKDELVNESEKANLEMQNRFDEYISKACGRNIEEFKNRISSFSEQYPKIEMDQDSPEFEYLTTEEYLNSTTEYKTQVKKLYHFADFLLREAKNYIEKLNFSEVQKEFFKIQERIKTNNMKIVELEDKIEKSDSILIRRAEIQKELESQKNDLEELINLTDYDEEIISISNEIKDFLNKHQSANIQTS
ncbi:MAG: hypothetical protein ACYDIA_18080 [Candidatus Humimicrobiaceae bacterium]